MQISKEPRANIIKMMLSILSNIVSPMQSDVGKVDDIQFVAPMLEGVVWMRVDKDACELRSSQNMSNLKNI